MRKTKLGSGQLQYCDLRSGTEPDREASYANTAVHVELLGTVFVPASDVRYAHQTAQVESTVDEIQRQLAAAVNVASEGQIDTQLGMIEEMRVVDQQNVDCIRHHQRFELLQAPVALYFLRMLRCKIAPVVYPDQIKRRVTEPDRCA